MSKRIRNYRTGDRAEDFGIFLLRAFCAVAPIPRQEDFGLADAVATLLRPEGRFWYAEDSFLVQFKSRTEKKVTLERPVFERWLAQDLSILVGRVNLIENTIELFTVGAALFDRRVHEATGLVLWLMDGEEGLRDGVLHLRLEKPILRWSAADTEEIEFTDRTYAVLKHWLKLERWNRRYLSAGVAREILWETNKMPTEGSVVHTWSPALGREALADIEPLVHLIGLYARHHPELWTRVHAVEDALRGPDDPSMLAGMRPFQRLTDAPSRLAAIARNHPTADAVVTIQMQRCDAEGANFWIYTCGRDGSSVSRRHEGTWAELKQKGFDYEIKGDVPSAKVTLNLNRYFASVPIPHEIVDGPDETLTVGLWEHSPCFFLRRVQADEPVSGTDLMPTGSSQEGARASSKATKRVPKASGKSPKASAKSAANAPKAGVDAKNKTVKSKSAKPAIKKSAATRPATRAAKATSRGKSSKTS